MAIFLTQFDVTLSDGSRKTYASEDIEANTLEEAQEIAKDMSPTLYVCGEWVDNVMPYRLTL
jgi:hypothetical protein|tara:strand:+ start:38 stop:223 length:186 start_codon:yes stop_codon:yes gene_type:complete